MHLEKNREDLGETDIFRILRKHHGVLKRYEVRRIGLFGSHRRGEQKRYSDIDLLVEFEKPTFDNFMGLCFDLEELFGKEVDLLTEAGLSPFIKSEVLSEVHWYEP